MNKWSAAFNEVLDSITSVINYEQTATTYTCVCTGDGETEKNVDHNHSMIFMSLSKHQQILRNCCTSNTTGVFRKVYTKQILKP